MAVHAEISIVCLPAENGTSMAKYVAAAFEAISQVDGVEATLTALGTQIVGRDLASILAAVSTSHSAAKSAGAERVISTVRIDDRADKNQTLHDKVESVRKRIQH